MQPLPGLPHDRLSSLKLPLLYACVSCGGLWPPTRAPASCWLHMRGLMLCMVPPRSAHVQLCTNRQRALCSRCCSAAPPRRCWPPAAQLQLSRQRLPPACELQGQRRQVPGARGVPAPWGPGKPAQGSRGRLLWARCAAPAHVLRSQAQFASPSERRPCRLHSAMISSDQYLFFQYPLPCRCTSAACLRRMSLCLPPRPTCTPGLTPSPRCRAWQRLCRR